MDGLQLVKFTGQILLYLKYFFTGQWNFAENLFEGFYMKLKYNVFFY